MSRTLPALMLGCLLVAAGMSTPCGAVEEADYARINAALSEHHIEPRYKRLAASAAAFDDAVTATCEAPPPRNLDRAREAFHQAMDGWMDVEHVQYGPIELFMRKFRFHYWPDKGSRGARQVRRILEGKNPDVLKPDNFRAASVAVQGFPTAERLLFTGTGAQALGNGANGDYACRFLSAIAFNIRDMATGLHTDWAGGANPFTRELRNPGGPDSRYENHRAVTAELLKGLHTTLIVIADLKLDKVVGKSLREAAPRRAESWRSRRSLRNIIHNLDALRTMYEGENGPGLKALVPPDKADLATLLSGAFEQTLTTARNIDVPLFEAVADPAKRPPVEKLATEVRALKQLIGTKLARALGTPLGFNALDGD